MKKITILTIITFALFGVALIVIFWLNGSLFFRLSNAMVTANGIVSNKNEVYKSGNGDYLIFVEYETGKTKTYTVFSKSEKVGIPNRPIPSSYSKSVKTNWFVFCWHTDSALAGTDKLDPNAKLNLSSNEISFQIYDDDVIIKF